MSQHLEEGLGERVPCISSDWQSYAVVLTRRIRFIHQRTLVSLIKFLCTGVGQIYHLPYVPYVPLLLGVLKETWGEGLSLGCLLVLK